MLKKEPINLIILEQMLDFIPADIPRDEWAKFLMSAKSEFGEAAKGIMQEWSARASNYNQAAFNSTWKSIKSGGGVTIGTLIHEAKENGFRFAPISKEEKQRLKQEQKQRAAARRQQENEEVKKRDACYEVAKQSAQAFLTERAALANPMHSYFVSKGIQGEAMTFESGGLNWVLQSFGTLLIPVCRFKVPANPIKEPVYFGNEYIGSMEGDIAQKPDYRKHPLFEVVSLQYIGEKGEKFFLKGGQIKEGFFPLRFSGDIFTIAICEGYATGVTYATHYAPHAEVICAFNAGNLKSVALAFRRRYPMAEIIIVADNDREAEQKSGVNVGIEKAKVAAKFVDGRLHIPEFSNNEVGTDFNDRFLLDKRKQLKTDALNEI